MNALVTYPSTLTVRQLRDLLKNWPDEDAHGEPTEVWIMTGDRLSSPCVEALTLSVGHLILNPTNYFEVGR